MSCCSWNLLEPLLGITASQPTTLISTLSSLVLFSTRFIFLSFHLSSCQLQLLYLSPADFWFLISYTILFIISRYLAHCPLPIWLEKIPQNLRLIILHDFLRNFPSSLAWVWAMHWADIPVDSAIYIYLYPQKGLIYNLWADFLLHLLF